LGLGKHWLAEQATSHEIDFHYLPTELMIADIMTKGPGAITGGAKAWRNLAHMIVT
jgi:hypothetical protein